MKAPTYRPDFWDHVEITKSCWLWTHTLTKGYGRCWDATARRWRATHRAAYETLIGPIPDGLVLDHLCRVTNCVNPEHLEPVTQTENTLRGESPPAKLARQTHCKRGHEFTPENTYTEYRGYRRCRACNAEAKRLEREAKGPIVAPRWTCPICGLDARDDYRPRHLRRHAAKGETGAATYSGLTWVACLVGVVLVLGWGWVL